MEAASRPDTGSRGKDRIFRCEWEGSPTELAQTIQTDMAVNRLTKHLNVNASRLLEEHLVKYENKTKHAGRRIQLTYMVVEASEFEVIE